MKKASQIVKKPITGEMKQSIVKTRTCFGPMHLCFQHVWSEMAKRKLDCKELSSFVKEIREMNKSLVIQVNRLLGTKGYSEEPVTHEKWDKIMNEGE